MPNQSETSAKTVSWTDRGLAGLRVLGLVGVALWTYFVPLDVAVQTRLLWLTAAYAAYCLLVCVPSAFSASLNQDLHIVRLAGDFGFVVLLVRLTGGAQSTFLFALYALLSVYSFRHGMLAGALMAAASAMLCVLWTPQGAAPLHWADVAVRVFFLFLIALSMGMFSERERRDKKKVRRLTEELAAKTATLQEAYDSLERMHERLLRVERLATIGRMSAQIAHEIRNPLSSLELNSELLEDELAKFGEAETAEARALLLAMQRDAEVLSHVTDDYLQFARLPKAQLEKVSLNAIVSNLMDSLTRELQEKGIALDLQLDEALPEIMCDRRQIRLALGNIVRNAIEAMSEGGKCGVSTGQCDGCARIAISDTGRGIAPKDMENIFAPFFTTKPQGTGLGLSLAQQIAEEHSGHVRCESQLGKGAKFILEIPVTPPRATDNSDGRRQGSSDS